MIAIEKYNPNWKKNYELEKEKIVNLFKDKLIAIHHIGSTSVPGLYAKPIIDIIVVVRNLNNIIGLLEKLDYKFKGEYNLPLRYYYSKSIPIKYHIHIHEEGSGEISLNLKFRDTLRKSKKLREEYSLVKKEASKLRNATKKTLTGIPIYNLKKNAIINKIIANSKFNGLCPRLCTQENEQKYFAKLEKKYSIFFENILLNINDGTEFSNLILYMGTDIVAGTKLFWFYKSQSMLISFLNDLNNHKNIIKNKIFLVNFIEKWGQRRGIQFIYTLENNSEFFSNLNYKLRENSELGTILLSKRINT